MVTAVAAPFPDNEGDDVESEIIREVLTFGRGMLAQGLTNLLAARSAEEMYQWELRLAHRRYMARVKSNWLGTQET